MSRLVWTTNIKPEPTIDRGEELVVNRLGDYEYFQPAGEVARQVLCGGDLSAGRLPRTLGEALQWTVLDGDSPAAWDTVLA